MKKKLIVYILVLLLVLSLTACGITETNNSEPISSETELIYTHYYDGEITNISDTLITLDVQFYGGPRREVHFEINEHTMGFSSDLTVGDDVVIKTEYMLDSNEPYPAILITKDTESE